MEEDDIKIFYFQVFKALGSTCSRLHMELSEIYRRMKPALYSQITNPNQ